MGGESLGVLSVAAAALAATEATVAIVVVAVCIRSAPAPLHRGAMIATCIGSQACIIQSFGAGTSTSRPGKPSTAAIGGSSISGIMMVIMAREPRTTGWTSAAPLSELALCKAGRQTDRQIRRHAVSQARRGVASRREGKQAGRDACAVAPSQGQLAVSALSVLLFS